MSRSPKEQVSNPTVPTSHNLPPQPSSSLLPGHPPPALSLLQPFPPPVLLRLCCRMGAEKPVSGVATATEAVAVVRVSGVVASAPEVTAAEATMMAMIRGRLRHERSCTCAPPPFVLPSSPSLPFAATHAASPSSSCHRTGGWLHSTASRAGCGSVTSVLELFGARPQPTRSIIVKLRGPRN